MVELFKSSLILGPYLRRWIPSSHRWDEGTLGPLQLVSRTSYTEEKIDLRGGKRLKFRSPCTKIRQRCLESLLKSEETSVEGES